MEVRLNRILGVEDGRALTDRSGALTLVDPSHVTLCQGLHLGGGLASVGFAPSTRRILSVCPASHHILCGLFVEPARVRVLAMLSSASHWLERSHPRFAELYQELVTAVSLGTSVFVGYSQYGRIEDVRPA